MGEKVFPQFRPGEVSLGPDGELIGVQGIAVEAYRVMSEATLALLARTEEQQRGLSYDNLQFREEESRSAR